MTPHGARERIADEVARIALVDTHEHIIDEGKRTSGPVDLFYLFKDYASSDLVSAGMSELALATMQDVVRPLEERWRDFAPSWEHVRTTGYGRAVLLAARDLYGADDINETTYRELSERIGAANRPGLYEDVLRRRANIEVAANQAIPELDPTPMESMDRRFFVPVVCLDRFVTPCSHSELAALEDETGVAIHSLADLVAAANAAFDRARAAGAVALKIALAYRRTLLFEKPAAADAERAFNRLAAFPLSWLADLRESPPVSWPEAKPLQDYLVHHLVRRCTESDLPILVHTGIQDGSGNFLANSDPLLLTNLIVEYREARFDLFHAGYPWAGEVAVLGKNFANVFVDLCWVHVISPWVARRVLHEWIETVPANKIMAFGGDYTFVEGAYAHSRLARANVASVLAETVESGYLAEDEAVALADKLLRDNARRFFRLPEAPQGAAAG